MYLLNLKANVLKKSNKVSFILVRNSMNNSTVNVNNIKYNIQNEIEKGEIHIKRYVQDLILIHK